MCFIHWTQKITARCAELLQFLDDELDPVYLLLFVVSSCCLVTIVTLFLTGKWILSDSYYKYGTLSCLGLDFSDRTVRLIGIFLQNCEQYL